MIRFVTIQYNPIRFVTIWAINKDNGDCFTLLLQVFDDKDTTL
jgi:hypothetical protein